MELKVTLFRDSNITSGHSSLSGQLRAVLLDYVASFSLATKKMANKGNTDVIPVKGLALEVVDVTTQNRAAEARNGGKLW